MYKKINVGKEKGEDTINTIVDKGFSEGGRGKGESGRLSKFIAQNMRCFYRRLPTRYFYSSVLSQSLMGSSSLLLEPLTSMKSG